MAKKDIVERINEVEKSVQYVPHWIGSNYIPLILIPLEKAKLLRKKTLDEEEAYEDQSNKRPSAMGISDNYRDVA